MSADTCPTVRIMPRRPSQGAFVEINAEDFDPAIHTPYVEAPAAPVLPPPPPGPPPLPPGPLDNLPQNWRQRSPAELRTLAASVTGRTPDDKKQAVEMIEAALKERK